MDDRFLTFAFKDERRTLIARPRMTAFRSLRSRTNAQATYAELPAQAEAIDQGLVTGKIAIFKVAQQALALVDQLQQTAAGVMILLVLFEMAGQVVDAGRQQRDLDFRRTGVVGDAAEISNDFAGLFYGE